MRFGRVHESHADTGIGYVVDPIANRYIASSSAYSSQRYGRKPFSGVHPWQIVGPPARIHSQSTLPRISFASRRIRPLSKCSRAWSTPQSSQAVSTDDNSQLNALWPVTQ